MQLRKEHLRERGWSEVEITHAAGILDQAKAQRPKERIHERLFWVLLFFAMAVIAAITAAVTPLFLVASTTVLLPVLMVAGVGFGFLFSTVMHDLDHLTARHHAAVIVAVPLTGLICFTAIASTGTVTGARMYDVILASTTFALFFITPYLYHLINRR